MTMRLTSMMIIATVSMWALTGCSNSEVAASTPAMTTEANTTTTTSGDDIDWSAIATNETPAERADYVYPFAIDSQNVRDYAEYFNIDNATAQHNLTISMASNEALSKVLDQLSGRYTSHELTDGKEMKLIIHTTSDVNASSYDYVLSDDFAKGLVLPIVIVPDGVKSEVDVHGEVAEN